MKRKKKGLVGQGYIVILIIACLLSGKIGMTKEIDIMEVLTENFSVVAVNKGMDRLSKYKTIKKEETVVPANIQINEKVDIIEKSVTYEKTSKEFTDYKNIFLNNHTSFKLDIKNLMEGYVPPEKKKNTQILVIHTHATEGYAESQESRSTDTNKNMVRIGDTFAKALKDKGFVVVHDVKLHDYPSYNGSYANSLKTIKWYLEQYPDIDIVFDLHRDAVATENNSRIKFSSKIDGESVAQLMLVVGTNEGGLVHDKWENNLKFAVGLQNAVCEKYPNLMRAIDLRQERFNQHVTDNAVIVEVGSDGNDIEEAEKAVKLLAESISRYIK